VAKSAQDWQDCASQWLALKLPESVKKAVVCRRRAMAEWKPIRLP
jgi:hypothetical protein